MLLHEQVRPKTSVDEPLAIDGFETFEYSQYAPMHVNLLVGARSMATYGSTQSELRRKGRMTTAQKRRRSDLETRHGRPDPGAVQRGISELIRTFVPSGAEIELRSDEHPAYRRALREVADTHRIIHRVTPSTAPRTARNPLFAVNATDSLIRHSCKNHCRETIAFSKRRQSIMDRHAIFTIWRNLLKSFSENKNDAPPGVQLGWVPFRPTVEQLLARRQFPSRVALTAELERQYQRRIPTRYLAQHRFHELKYAY